MSAEVVNALQQQAHALDAEADNSEASGQDSQAGSEPHFLRRMAREFRHLAERVQGKDPAASAAEQQAKADQGAGSDGLSVEKSGEPDSQPTEALPVTDGQQATVGQPVDTSAPQGGSVTADPQLVRAV